MSNETPKHFIPLREAFDTGNPIAMPIGRIELGDGTIVRIVAMPDGVHIVVSQGATHVHFTNDELHFSGLGKFPK